MSEQENNVPHSEETSVEVKKSEKVQKTDSAEKRPNFFVRTGKRITKWFRDLKSEAKKVVWPTGKQVVNNTIIVIIAIIVVAVFVAVLDVAFGAVRDLIVKLV